MSESKETPALKKTLLSSTLVLDPDQPNLHDLKYVFEVSRCVKPVEFKNLWRLAVKTPQESNYTEVIDADSLGTVIDRIRYLFEQDGL